MSVVVQDGMQFTQHPPLRHHHQRVQLVSAALRNGGGGGTAELEVWGWKVVEEPREGFGGVRSPLIKSVEKQIKLVGSFSTTS